MAQNPAQDYGVDIACVVDADELFSEADGVAVVVQDGLHAITQEDFLGPGGDGRGVDVRTFIGGTQAFLTSRQPLVVEVLQRDERMTNVDIVLTAIVTRGLADVRMEISGSTDAGPFKMTVNVLELTASQLEAGDG